MADTHDSRTERGPRAANATLMVRLKQANDAHNLSEILAWVASGKPLSSSLLWRWFTKLDPSVREAIEACRQEYSRFPPAAYLRDATVDPLRPGASEADRDERLQLVNPAAYRALVAQRDVAQEALVAVGLPEAVAAIASAANVPTELPTTVKTMRAALVTVASHLFRLASEVTDRAMPGPAQCDPAVLWKHWVQAEQLAKDYNLSEIEELLDEQREKLQSTTPLDIRALRIVLEYAKRQVAFSQEAERVAKQHGVPALAHHLRAMRDAIAAEALARQPHIEQPRRVPGAEAAWAAMANVHGISVATLRQRGKQLPQLLGELHGQEQAEDPEKTDRQAPLKPPLRDRRKRSRRQLDRSHGSNTAGRLADQRSGNS